MKAKYLFQFSFCILLQHILFLGLCILFVNSNIISSLSSFYPLLIKAYPLNLISFIIPFLFFVLAVALDKLKDKNTEYGDAEFASNSEIAKMQDNGLFEGEGTIFALKDGRYIRTKASLSTLIVAPQGTGKTAAMIIPTLLSNTSSFLINDIKGELWDKTSKQRANFGRVGVFAPSQNLKDSFSWNPLDNKVMPDNFADQIDYVDRVGAILYPTEQDGLDATSKHFNGEAKSLFTYYCMMLISKNGGTSLPEVYRTALDSGDMQASIACDIDEYSEEWHPILRTIANGLMQKGGNEWQGTVTTFKQALEPFSRPNIARNLERCDFTHLDFKSTKPLSLYMFIPANDVSRMAPIIRMLIEYLVNEFLSLTDESIIKAQHVVFAMDEFPRMGYMKALKEAPALQRSYNMSSIFVAQDKNQLETTYGKGSFDQFVTTTDFKVIFRQNEDTTAARFSTLVGKTTRRKKSVSKRDLDLLGSSTENKEGLPLLLPQDFLNQKKNDLIILISGSYARPIKAKCAWWFKDAHMKKLIGAYNDLTISDLAQLNKPVTTTNDNNDPIINGMNENDVTHDVSDNDLSTETSETLESQENIDFIDDSKENDEISDISSTNETPTLGF